MNALPADRGVTKRVLGAEGVCAYPGSVPPLCKLLPAEFSLLHFFKEIKRLDLQPPNHKKKKKPGAPRFREPPSLRLLPCVRVLTRGSATPRLVQTATTHKRTRKNPTAFPGGSSGTPRRGELLAVL